jgi:hypothetical protein
MCALFLAAIDSGRAQTNTTPKTTTKTNAITSTLNDSQNKPMNNQEPKGEGLRQLFANVFARWDSNHDGRLTLPEVIAVMENPRTTTDEAAAAMVVQHSLDIKHGDNPAKSLSLADVLALGSSPESEKSFERIRTHMGSINHELFLPAEPNIDEIHQGPVGDCYLLSPIAALVNCNPQAVRSMIRPSGDGYDVAFGNGTTIHVRLTEADLILPGLRKKSGHGIWLSVLQKAYFHIKGEQAQAKHGSEFVDEMTEGEILGGGSSAAVISLLTGHQFHNLNTRPQIGESAMQATARVSAMLTRLTDAKKVMTTSAGQAGEVLPAHIPRGHIHAVLGYDPVSRVVHVFNPWGNNVTPDGPPGLVNGYVIRDGHFDVPVDEFVRIFGGVGYETDQQAMPRGAKHAKKDKKQK